MSPRPTLPVHKGTEPLHVELSRQEQGHTHLRMTHPASSELELGALAENLANRALPHGKHHHLDPPCPAALGNQLWGGNLNKVANPSVNHQEENCKNQGLRLASISSKALPILPERGALRSLLEGISDLSKQVANSSMSPTHLSPKLS